MKQLKSKLQSVNDPAVREILGGIIAELERIRSIPALKESPTTSNIRDAINRLTGKIR